MNLLSAYFMIVLSAALGSADALHTSGLHLVSAVNQPPEAQPDARPDAPPDKADDPLLTKSYKKAMIIDVRGSIFGGLQAYLSNRLEAAQRGSVDLILLRVTSPGGDADASFELARRLSAIDWATTVAFVPEEAYSGAAILSLGCDRIYMRPRAIIGDAGPIRFHGGMFEHADEKIVSALAVAIHELAESKDRPGSLAEAMVDRKLIVHQAKNKQTGEVTFLTAQEAELPQTRQQFDIGEAIAESGQDRFLTVSGSRAVELQLADGVFDSERDMLASFRIDQISETRQTWVDRTVYVLNRPLITGLLLLIGLIGLYIEFSIPGITVAALVSLTCFALFFWSHALGGTSGWLEVMLFALGVGCLSVELFILPGFGIFGLSGMLMLVVSLVMASQDFVLPNTTVEWSTLRNNLLIVLGAMACLVIALIVQVTFFDSIPGLGRLRLDTPEVESFSPGDSATEATANTSLASSALGETMPRIGETGIADSILRPAGKVRFGQRLIDVVTEGDFLDAGTEVEVVKREGNRVVVRQLA